MIVNDYIFNNDRFVFPFKINEKEKIREIITYKDDYNGKALRSFHENLLKKLNKLPSSKYSYAYKKNLCTKDALRNHFKSNFFIKLDIKSFFDSITSDKFFSVCDNTINKKYYYDLQTCFYHNHLSLGYITSPKISDLYLYKFDCLIEKYLKKNKSLRYSRYSDDILISSTDTNNLKLNDFLSFIKSNLLIFDLNLNESKIREFNLSKELIKNQKNFKFYPAVTFLGLNLVRKDNETVITISKHFILKTLDLIEKKNKLFSQIIAIERNHKELIDLKYKKKKNVYFDNNRLNELLEQRKLLRKLKFDYRDLHSIICSRVGYIKHNSKVSYQRFLDKHYNKFNKKWSKY